MSDDVQDNGERGDGEESAADLIDGQKLGVMMMQQLTDLVDSWADVLQAVAQHGVDPTPLLRALAGTLRDTADQLDPAGAPGASEGAGPPEAQPGG